MCEKLLTGNINCPTQHKEEDNSHIYTDDPDIWVYDI